jgi:cytochrome c553
MATLTILMQSLLTRLTLGHGTAALAVLLSLQGSPAHAQAAAPASPALPSWAYPVNPPFPVFDDKTLHRVPGSTKEFTQAQVENDFAPPDWHPEDHPALPHVVSSGRPPAVRACMKCHLTNGGGHPGSSDLAGMSVAYLTEQMPRGSRW